VDVVLALCGVSVCVSKHIMMTSKNFDMHFGMVVQVAKAHGHVTRHALCEMFGLSQVESSQLIREVIQRHPELFSWDASTGAHRAELTALQKVEASLQLAPKAA
jgi:CO dehydrogenase/acetyl-CoA synthase delta subunit